MLDGTVDGFAEMEVAFSLGAWFWVKAEFGRHLE